MAEEKELRVTYYLKNDIECPVCEAVFKKEELLSGGGRLIAGSLTDELRRLYEPNEKYGKISPLNYTITVCPNCLYATFPGDFKKISSTHLEIARLQAQKRMQMVMQTFGSVDFQENRADRMGAASYVLALNSYCFFGKNSSPTIKKAICALRAAWLLGDLAEGSEMEHEKQRFYHVQGILYKKALLFYNHMMDIMSSGEEVLDGVQLGPDTDKDWGYQGFLYIFGMLNFRLGYLIEDIEARAMRYIETKRVVSKLFGSGKKSRSKPSQILDMSRDLYDNLSAYVTQIEEELGKKFE